MKNYLLILVIALKCMTISAQNRMQPYDDIQKYVMTYDYNGALNILRSGKSQYLSAPQGVNYYYQALATVYALNGLVSDSLLKYEFIGLTGRDPQNGTKRSDTINISSYNICNAKELIIKSAKNEQVLMINESHLRPSNRLFMKSLLEQLRNSGYTNFCVEALEYNSSKYDDIKSIMDLGFYTKEPCYAEMMREALRLGFNIYGYEATPSDYKSSNNRDSIQAVHLRDITRANDGKTIIYAGYGHTSKTSKSSMYNYFKNLSGVTPLSVNQTTFIERPSRKHENVLYIALWENYPDIREPMAIANIEKTGDICTFTPRLKYIENRPDYLLENGDRRLRKIKVKGPSLIKAYYNAEFSKYGEQCVPVDITISDRSNIGCLFLPRNTNIKIIITPIK